MDTTKRNVVKFGIVSFLTDVSSEMVLSVFAVFFTTVLGLSTRVLGLLEGFADFSASALDYFAGYVGDRTGRYKKVSAVGYSISAASKILLASLHFVTTSFVFRIMDRLGKSIRGAPRDAWLASVVCADERGYAFAFHKTFDKLGAITGPLIAYFLISYFGESVSTYHLLFWLATIPGVIAVILLLRIPQNPVEPKARESIFATFHLMSDSFKKYVFCGAIFSLSYLSFGFFLLKAYTVGFTVAQVALLYAIVSIAFVFVAVPIGKFGDIVGRKWIIASSYLLFALISLGFAFSTTKLSIVILLLLFGVFLAIDDSQTKAFITDLEHEKRGSAIGFYNFVLSFGFFFASLAAGFLWAINPMYTFVNCAFIASVAFLLFAVKMRNVH